MTEEVRNKIDALRCYHHQLVSYDGKTYGCEFLMKSDVVSLVEELTRWNKVEYCVPVATNEVDDIFYSEYLYIKVEGYKHPFIGYYVKANDDEFFDFIHQSLQNELEGLKVTEWKYIN